MKNILIVTAIPDTTVSAYYALALTEAVSLGPASGFSFQPVLLKEESSSMLLNLGISLVSAQEIDGVIFVNRDIAFKGADLIDLVQSDKDAVGMAVTSDDSFQLNLGEISRIESDPVTGEVKVLSISTDLLYLTKKACDLLCESNPKIDYNGSTTHSIIRGAESFASFHTDRELLSYRLKEIGIQLWVNPQLNAVRASRTLQGYSLAQWLSDQSS